MKSHKAGRQQHVTMHVGVYPTLIPKLVVFETIMDVWTRPFVILPTKLNSVTDLTQVVSGMCAYSVAEVKTVIELSLQRSERMN